MLSVVRYLSVSECCQILDSCTYIGATCHCDKNDMR